MPPFINPNQTQTFFLAYVKVSYALAVEIGNTSSHGRMSLAVCPEQGKTKDDKDAVNCRTLTYSVLKSRPQLLAQTPKVSTKFEKPKRSQDQASHSGSIVYAYLNYAHAGITETFGANGCFSCSEERVL